MSRVRAPAGAQVRRNVQRSAFLFFRTSVFPHICFRAHLFFALPLAHRVKSLFGAFRSGGGDGCAQGCLFVFLASCECGCGAGSAKTAAKPLRHAASTVAMFHLYNPNSGEHFYTGNATEIDSLVCTGWESGCGLDRSCGR